MHIMHAAAVIGNAQAILDLVTCMQILTSIVLTSVLAAEGLGSPALLPQRLDDIFWGYLQLDKAMH